MSNLFDKESIDIPCPNCSKKHNKTISWLKRNKNITCTCGAAISLENKKFIKEIKSVEKQLNSLFK